MVMVVNHAPPDAAEFILPSGDRAPTMIGIPTDTIRPPTLARTILTEVRIVISLVSLVSEELSAP